MAISYNRLFYRLIDLKMSNTQLAKEAGVSLNIMTRLKRDEYVSLESIERICKALHCTVDEVLEFIPDVEEEK